MLVPKLRFKEFSGEWKLVNLSSIFTYYSTNSLSREQLSESGLIKNIHYGDIHKKYGCIVDSTKDISTYIKDINYNNKYQTCKENDLIFADASEDYEGIGKAIELKNVNNLTIISGLHTILARDNNNNFAPKFKGYLFNTPNVHNQIKVLANGFKVFGISKSIINQLVVYIPSKSEQLKIANMMELLDKKIELQSKKIEALKLYKKGVNNRIFNDFDKEYYINDLIEEYNNKTKINNQYPILSSTLNGIFIQSNYFNKQAASIDNIGYKIVPKNYITYRSMSDTGEFHFNIQDILENGIVSPAYPVFNTNNKVDKNYFINYLNENQYFKNDILSKKEGGTRYALNITKLKSIKIKLPSIDKQLIYGNFLILYNSKLYQENLKLSKLQELKKGLMQNMFV